MLSKRVQNLKPSPTLALATKAKELKAQGKDVISLSVGEPDWDSFEPIKQAGIEAIKTGQTKYTPVAGTPELRQAICEQTNQDLGTAYDASQVTVSSGGKFVIFSLLQSVIDPGDEVIVPAPYWVSYPVQVELAEGQPVVVTCTEKENFKLTAELLEQAITSKTKMLILNSPSNPTGFMYSEDELKAIAEVLKKHPQIIVLSDDIYNRLIFEGELAPHLLRVAPELVDRVVVINGASKTYSMTGWRLGWALGPKDVIAAMTRYQSQSVSNACSITQAATVAAITQSKKELSEALAQLKSRRDYVVERIKQLPEVKLNAPDGAFYVWPDFSYYLGKSFNGKTIESTKDFAEALLEDQLVAAVPGVEFGLEGYMRISYALKQERMQEAIERIAKFLEQIDS